MISSCCCVKKYWPFKNLSGVFNGEIKKSLTLNSRLISIRQKFGWFLLFLYDRTNRKRIWPVKDSASWDGIESGTEEPSDSGKGHRRKPKEEDIRTPGYPPCLSHLFCKQHHNVVASRYEFTHCRRIISTSPLFPSWRQRTKALSSNVSTRT